MNKYAIERESKQRKRESDEHSTKFRSCYKNKTFLFLSLCVYVRERKHAVNSTKNRAHVYGCSSLTMAIQRKMLIIIIVIPWKTTKTTAHSVCMLFAFFRQQLFGKRKHQNNVFCVYITIWGKMIKTSSHRNCDAMRCNTALTNAAKMRHKEWKIDGLAASQRNNRVNISLIRFFSVSISCSYSPCLDYIGDYLTVLAAGYELFVPYLDVILPPLRSLSVCNGLSVCVVCVCSLSHSVHLVSIHNCNESCRK